jgi:hypothetical protein
MKDGMLVHPAFNSDMHIMNDIVPVMSRPLYFGFDFGLTPACTIEQIDAEGRIYTLHEVTSFGMDLIQMLDNLVMPLLNTKFKGFKIGTTWHDPAGFDPSQANGESCHDVLKRYGFNPDETMGRYQDQIEKRVRATNKTLDRMIGGKPAYYLDGKNCPMLKKAFLKEYKYRRLLIGGSDPKYADKPEKNKFSHIIEAHQYFCVGMDEPITRDEIDKSSLTHINQHEWGF